MNPDGPARLFRALWKIPVGDAMTDNFDSGKSGNLVAEIDRATGKVLRVQSGAGLVGKEVFEHPETGVTFRNFQIPDWHEYVALAERATSAFPGIRLQHWDLAITRDGPVILELNTFGSLDFVQLSHQKGFLDAEFMEFLDDLARKYPAYAGKGDY